MLIINSIICITDANASYKEISEIVNLLGATNFLKRKFSLSL